MSNPPPGRPRSGRLFHLLGLACLLGGFALELVGAAVGRWTLFKAGLFVFLLAAPFFLIGFLVGRRKA